jgi:hypothetical protein
MWIGVLLSTGKRMVLAGLAVITIGTIVYLLKARYNKEWPFRQVSDEANRNPAAD